ncbi:MAG TPA: transglycosylase family protein [Thermoleophilaceae bacterium]|nr:transglycosylase family protein [Thermoleophilaceae bacterium]
MACTCALAVTLMSAGAAAPPTGGLGVAEADAAAKKAPERFRAGYRRWRGRLQRHDLYVGRNLLPRVRAADGSARPPTRRELRRCIRWMERRWARFTRTTRRGRNAMFKLKVRRAVPRWGKQHLRSIRWCESRNKPRAVGGGGAYRGLYQFSFRTWYVVGGAGDPAAAVRHEQTWRAWLLLSRHGSGHWPVCG